MKKFYEGQSAEQHIAQKRAEDIHQYFASLKQALEQRLASLKDANMTTVDAILTKLDEIQFAHRAAVAAEEVANANLQNTEKHGAIDFAKERDQIGRQLDRLRTAIRSDIVSEGIETEPGGGPPIPV